LVPGRGETGFYDLKLIITRKIEEKDVGFGVAHARNWFGGWLKVELEEGSGLPWGGEN